MKYRLFFILASFLLSAAGISQSDLQKPITDKAVIGFPGITQQQLAEIKEELISNPLVQNAYFIFGDHNCLMLKLNIAGQQKSFYDVLKPLDKFYEATDKCYIKPYDVYDFIESKAGNTPVYPIKP